VNITRLLALIRKEFIQIVRDPRTLTIVFVMPVLQLLLMGFSMSNDVRNVPLAVLDMDRSPAARSLLDAFRSADYFHIDYDVTSETELRQLIDDGKAGAGLIIPAGYGDQIASGNTARVAFVVDGSDPSIAATGLSAAQLITQNKSTALVLDRLSKMGQSNAFHSLIELRTQVWYNPDLINAYNMVPAMIGVILTFLTIQLTATAVVRERERGTMEQLAVTPLNSIELMIGKLAPFVIIAVMIAIEVVLLGVLIWNVPITGSLVLLFALIALFLVTTLGLGLFISTIAKTQREAQMYSMLFVLPAMFLSGFYYPVTAMPQFLQYVSYAIPLRYFLVIVRSVVLKGVGPSALIEQIVALALFGFFITLLAVWRFRKTLD
jgi:drug efflux transport system permease protein